MSNTRRVYGDRGQYIGYVNETGGGVQYAYDSNGHLLGSYQPSSNQTFNDRGARVMFGNAVDALIYISQVN